MKSNEEIIKIFKKKIKFDIAFIFAGFTLILGVLIIFTNSVTDGLIVAFTAMILFCCIALIYELYVRFYNLNALKKGNYSIHINPQLAALIQVVEMVFI